MDLLYQTRPKKSKRNIPFDLLNQKSGLEGFHLRQLRKPKAKKMINTYDDYILLLLDSVKDIDRSKTAY